MKTVVQIKAMTRNARSLKNGVIPGHVCLNPHSGHAAHAALLNGWRIIGILKKNHPLISK